ncbi:hypothetical protein J6590_026535 [Homalodisca vitripennis]|nr:hypothetical protein J6590_026535 [Homalodisca vitripennis]
MECERNMIVCSTTGIIVKNTPSATKGEKNVTIVEPPDIHLKQEWKKITDKRHKITSLIDEQVEKRTKEFKIQNEVTTCKRCCTIIRKYVCYLYIFLLCCLLVTMTQASVCHKYNSRCELFWYEVILSGLVDCFVTTWHERIPVVNLQ